MRRAAVLLTLVFGSLGACADGRDVVRVPEVVDPAPSAESWQAATSEVFGDGAEHADIVARGEGFTVTAGEVAAYLRLFPTLSVEQAVEDLVDVAVATTSGPDRASDGLGSELVRVARYDAQVRARVLAWVRANLFESGTAWAVDPAKVNEYLADPTAVTLHSTPPLAVASHVLLVCDEACQTPERAAAVVALGERLFAHVDARQGQLKGEDLVDAAAAVLVSSDPLMEGLDVNVNVRLTFPRRYAGPPTWRGLPAAVDPFADAAFDAEIGTMVGPVQSEFGWHFIVSESIQPGASLPPDEQRARIEDYLRHSQRRNAFAAALRAQLATVDVAVYEDNVRLLAMTPDERMELQRASQSDRFR